MILDFRLSFAVVGLAIVVVVIVMVVVAFVH